MTIFSYFKPCQILWLMYFLCVSVWPPLLAQTALGIESFTYLLDHPSERPYSSYMTRADQFYKQRDYRHAIYNFNFARELEPRISNDFLFSFKLGYSYKATHKFDSASVHLLKASADPLMGDYALFQLAQIFSKQDSVAEAITHFKKLLQKFPNTVFYIETCLNLAGLLFSQNQPDAADVYINQAAGILKDDPVMRNVYQSRILLLRGNSYVQKNNFNGALEIFRKIQEDFRYTDEAYKAKILSESIRRQQNTPATIDQFIDGNNVLILQGYYQMALNELAENKARFTLPHDQTEIEYNIARIYFAQGLYNAAIPRYQYLWKKYQHKESLFNLGKAARYQGDLALSTSAYRDYRDKAFLTSAWKNYITYEIANNFSAMGDSASLRQANLYYAEVRLKTPLSAIYGYTAAFRTAFNLYKLSEYDSCIVLLAEIQNAVDFLKPKCQFWTAKAYEKKKELQKANAIYERLASDQPRNYYGMLSHYLRRNNPKHPDDSFFYVNSSVGQDEKSSLFNFDMIKKLYFRIEQDNGRFYFNDRSLQSLEKEFIKAWIGKEILEPKYAQMELYPLRKKYLESIESAVLFRNYLEFLEAYDLAVETNVAMKKKFKSFFKSEEESAKLFYPRYYQSYVRQYAQKYGLDEAFVFALIKNESAFKTYSISKARAIGLMQIMPFTGNTLARELNLDHFEMMDLQQPEKSILLGTYYLHQQAMEYKNFIPAILGAYNAGPHRADFWMRFYNPDEPEEFPEIVELFETNNYIKKILLDRWIYSQP
ncbi:transglycosylase SLT domain-containing protein [bacterium]|nr:MAG: transglycosylase SLT domain-containing protein [bacterium]